MFLALFTTGVWFLLVLITHSPCFGSQSLVMSAGRMRLPACLILLLFLAPAVSAQVPQQPAKTKGKSEPPISADHERFFERQIRPVLVERCIECHGTDTQENGLRLDSREAILRGGKRGPSVDLQQVERSLLLQVLRPASADDLQMPPGEKLSSESWTAFAKWIRDGLPWPHASTVDGTLSKHDRYDQIRKTHWAFQPVISPKVPMATVNGWAKQPLDLLVAQQQHAEQVTPSPIASRYVLLRRATFDLLGLPPTAEEMATFVASQDPDALSREIDRLLASPHYGERWGRHWLDVARYADTKGYAFQRERRFPYAYTYRDYVIRAFNEDLPYDQFLREQLAADQLDLGPQNDALAALGLLTVGRKYNNVHSDRDDLIDVVSRGMLGLTVACARCHDHKYDAIPTEDYYSLYGVFASIHEPRDLPLLSGALQTPGYAKFKQRLDELVASRDALREKYRVEMITTARQHPAEYLVRAITKLSEQELAKLDFLSLTPDEWRPRLVQSWREYLLKTAQPDHALWGPLHNLFHLPNEQFATQAPGVLKRWLAKPQGVEEGCVNPLVHVALGQAKLRQKSDIAKLYGQLFQTVYSNWKDKTSDPQQNDVAQITKVIFGADGPNAIPLDQVQSYVNRAARDKLTRATKEIDKHMVESPNAPPRAMVVADNDTPHEPHVLVRGNPGRRGKRVPRQFLYALAGTERQPFSHGSGRLELAAAITAVDNPLTRRVIANRVWMHHFGQPLVATPSDFGVRCDPPRQQALLDHLAASMLDDAWSLKSMHRRIMTSATYQQASLARAEMQALDPENVLLWKMNRRRLEFEPLRDALLAAAGSLDTRMGGRAVDIVKAPYSRRRTVYGFIDRQHLPNLFRVFDFANPDQSSARRPNTLVPQQTLFMLNSHFVTRLASQVVASDEFANAKGRQARVQVMYRKLFAREPSVAEIQIASEFMSRKLPQLKEIVFPRWHQLAQLLLASNEFIFVD